MIKSLANKDATDLPLYVNFHGGGGYAGNPADDIGLLSRLVVENKIVCFSVGYRLGPENLYPKGVNDAKAAVDYFIENAEKYGCDPNRLAVGGTSAGSWITCGANILLSREGRSDKVKLMILSSPMLGGSTIYGNTPKD